MIPKPTVIERKKQKSFVAEWTNTIVWAGLIAVIFRSFFLEPFNIPSGSMIPTLQVGDHLFVSKWNFGYSRFSFPFGSMNLWSGRFWQFGRPERGDIVVFRKPNDSIEYVKRLIGMPGDTIQMKSGRLYINGVVVPRDNPKRYIIADLFCEHNRARGYVYVDKDNKSFLLKGDKIYFNGEPVDFNYTIIYENPSGAKSDNCMVFEGKEYTETLPNGKKYQIFELHDDMVPGIGRPNTSDNTEVFKVPMGRYFMMGDDRDLSDDSRFNLGYVPYDNFMGRVLFVFYSHNYYSPLLFAWDWPNKMRANRFGIFAK